MGHVSPVLVWRDAILLFEQLNEILNLTVPDHLSDIGYSEFGILEQLGSLLQPFSRNVVGHVLSRLLFEQLGKVDGMKMRDFP